MPTLAGYWIDAIDQDVQLQRLTERRGSKRRQASAPKGRAQQATFMVFAGLNPTTVDAALAMSDARRMTAVVAHRGHRPSSRGSG